MTKNSLRAAAIAALTFALLLAAPATAGASTDTGPGADLATVPPDIAGIPTVFVAIQSGHGDTRGLTFEYDFDGDGAYDLTSEDAVAEYTYAEEGVYNAGLRVTDEFHRTSEVTIEVKVAPPSVLGPPQFPAEGAPEAKGVSIDRNRVAPGDSVELTVDTAEQFGARLVRQSGANDPWQADYVETYGPFKKSPATFAVGNDIKSGKYWLLVTTKDMQMSKLALTVELVDEGASLVVLIVATTIAGVIAIIIAFIVIFIIRRRRKRRPPVDTETEDAQ
jgi:hypothetical protein